jgi:hypothetical protein
MTGGMMFAGCIGEEPVRPLTPPLFLRAAASLMLKVSRGLQKNMSLMTAAERSKTTSKPL